MKNNITKEQFENFKKAFPTDKEIQSITFENFLKETENITVDWETLLLYQKPDLIEASLGLSDCQVACGYVIFDCICLALGATSLRAGVKKKTAEAIARAAEPILEEIQSLIRIIGREGSSAQDIAEAVFKILKAIVSKDCLYAVAKAFLDSLSITQKLLYSLTLVATVLAIVATDGIAFIAEIVIEIATFGFLVSDGSKAIKACKL